MGLRCSSAGIGLFSHTGTRSAPRTAARRPVFHDAHPEWCESTFTIVPLGSRRHEPPDSTFLVAQGIGDLEPVLHGPGVERVHVIDLDRDAGAAGSSLPTMLTCTTGVVGEATVTIQPTSIATSKPSTSTKKSRSRRLERS